MIKVKYVFFIIYNDKSVYENNILNALDLQEIDKELIEIIAFDNSESYYISIREWLNEKIQEIASNHARYRDSIVFFSHQDVFFDKYFLSTFESIYNDYSNLNIGLIGFAGIDKKGISHVFMCDSGEFRFTGQTHPVKIDSADEFLFCIKANILIKEKIELSNINGWHAYAAEFSMLLKCRGYDTFCFPIFTYHNSIRQNNDGIFKTHRKLFSIYNYPINTLVGSIKYYNSIYKVRRLFYDKYVNFVKFKINNFFTTAIKSFLLDKLRISFSINRYIQVLTFKKEVNFFFYTLSNNYLPKSLKIITNYSTLYFFQINKIDEYVKGGGKEVTIVWGYPEKIKGFKFFKKNNVNIRK